MSAAKGPDGKFFRVTCPDCKVPMICDGVDEYGKRQFRCDELADPNDDNKPLYACMRTYLDGDPLP
jgi:hypothetical protein